MFEIMFNDLKPEAQKQFLKYMGFKDASEGNYEFVPIATVDYNDDADDEDDEADETICLKEGNYVEDPNDSCLLVDPDLIFDGVETVDVSFEGNPDHYTRYRVTDERGDFGETILSPTGYEYDEENEDRKMPWERY